jgi:hypothetical protein
LQTSLSLRQQLPHPEWAAWAACINPKMNIKNARDFSGIFVLYLLSGLCPETHLGNFFEKKLP